MALTVKVETGVGVGVSISLGQPRVLPASGAPEFQGRVWLCVRRELKAMAPKPAEMRGIVALAAMQKVVVRAVTTVQFPPITLGVVQKIQETKVMTNYVPAQTVAVMNADLTALNAQLATLKAVRKTVPAGVNPRDVQHLDVQIKQLTAVVGTINRRLNRNTRLS